MWELSGERVDASTQFPDFLKAQGSRAPPLIDFPEIIWRSKRHREESSADQLPLRPEPAGVESKQWPAGPIPCTLKMS